ncbi:hypothetical protein GCM10009118_33260 [Wandonia haliotis]|uniref:DUF177 domain-containing protein n=1 Tax=Wandonia haliotis TaxID=574963 RepID=A0ABP3Y633_9FLAO
MKSSLRNYNVQFSGLKDGLHQVSFEIGAEFFENFEYSLIESGEVLIDMELDKKPNMLTTRYKVKGVVNTTCDRCADPLELPVEGAFKLVFKFGKEQSDNEELIVLPPEAYMLEMAPYFYEFINVLLPARKVHEEGECNEEMVTLISQYSINSSDPDDEDDFEDDWDEDEEE